MSKVEESKKVCELELQVPSSDPEETYPDRAHLILWDNGVRELMLNSYSKIRFNPEMWLVFVDFVAALTRAEIPKVHSVYATTPDGQPTNSRYEPLTPSDPRVKEALANLKKPVGLGL